MPLDNGSPIELPARAVGQRLSETMGQLQTEHLVKFGLIPEFIGRLPVLATLEDLDEAALIMATLPFALTGGVWLLYLLGFNQSVATGVGFVIGSVGGTNAAIGALYDATGALIEVDAESLGVHRQAYITKLAVKHGLIEP